MRVQILVCTRASTRMCVFEYSRATRARHARAVKLLVNGTVHYNTPFIPPCFMPCSNWTDMQQWIGAINKAAALYSSPPLAAPVSSSSKFQRPTFPITPTKLNLVSCYSAQTVYNLLLLGIVPLGSTVQDFIWVGGKCPP